MAKNEVCNILYIEQDIESVTQLKRILREQGVNSKYLLNVVSMDQFESIKEFLDNDPCDLIILRDSPKLPSFMGLQEAIGLKDYPVLMIVDEHDFLEKQSYYAEGAVGVATLTQGSVLFQLIVRAIYTKKTQVGYRNVLEKNQELVELTANFIKDTDDLIAYFDPAAGTFMYANDAFLKSFNISSLDDLLVNTVLDFVDGSNSAEFKKLMKIVSKTGKDQSSEMSFIDFSTGEKIEKSFSLRKALYEEMPCLELFFKASDTKGEEASASQALAIERSDAEILYNRPAFFESLGNYTGSSSWLVCLVMQDYLNIRKKYGVKVLEEYLVRVANLLKSQIKGLHLVRFSDESFVLLMPNSDMASVDRIGMAIVSAASTFHFKEYDLDIHSSYRFVYANLGDDIEQIPEILHSIDSQAGLLNQKSTTEGFEEDENDVDMSIASDEDAVESEFLPLHATLKNNTLKLMYEPVVDFSMGSEGLYLATYNLIDENGKVIFWNKSFTHTANNEVVKALDEFLIKSVWEALSGLQDENRKVIIPLSMYFLAHQSDFFELLSSLDKTGKLQSSIIFGISEEAVDLHTDIAISFFDVMKAKGYMSDVYDVADIAETKANQMDVSIIALSENCVSRMSRGMSSDESKKFTEFLSIAKKQNIRVLARGVNSAAMMAMVWEYTIPLAAGNMVGSLTEKMDFDFSQVLM